MTPEGRALDDHLTAAIEELKIQPPEESKMRGITRLANATQVLLKQADAEADSAAAEVEAAVNEQMDVAAQYKKLASDARAKAKEARDALNQMSNDPTESGGSGQTG